MANVDMDDLEQALIQEAQNLESIDAATDLEIVEEPCQSQRQGEVPRAEREVLP